MNITKEINARWETFEDNWPGHPGDPAGARMTREDFFSYANDLANFLTQDSSVVDVQCPYCKTVYKITDLFCPMCGPLPTINSIAKLDNARKTHDISIRYCQHSSPAYNVAIYCFITRHYDTIAHFGNYDDANQFACMKADELGYKIDDQVKKRERKGK